MSAPPQFRASPGYARYVLVVLLLIYIMNFVDRQILAIVAQDIKDELEISDTSLGFLLGPAFAFFYTFAGIPIARLADLTSRRTVIAVGLVIWSAMTAATGFARSFFTIALCRFGVGVGEAAGTPPSHSLISDYFPPERRATAMSIYATGIYFGLMFGFMAGGVIRDAFDWRTAFLFAGAVGLPLALLLRFTVREPPRGASEHHAIDTEPPALGEVLRFLFAKPAFRMLTLAACFQSLSGYAILSWAPTYLIRVHGMTGTEMAFSFGLIAGLTGAFGVTFGGVLADRLGARDTRWYVWLPAIVSVVALPFAFPFYLSDDRTLALTSFAPFYLLNNMYVGPLWSIAQNLVHVRMRALASASLLAILNIAGLAIGPQLVGIMNDALSAEYGDGAIRYSLVVMAILGAFAAFFFVRCARTLDTELVSRPRGR